MSNDGETFQWNVGYDVGHVFLRKSCCQKYAFVATTLNVKSLKTRLSRVDALFSKSKQASWPFIWCNRYIRTFCVGKVKISIKSIAAKNIGNSYGSKTLNDFYQKICNFLALFISQQANLKMTELFSKSFEMSFEILAQKNPFFILKQGSFNAKSKNWCSNNVASCDGTTFKFRLASIGQWVEANFE